MTDTEAFKWLVNRFKTMRLDFSTPSDWNALEKAVTRFKQVYSNSAYIELLERYYRALYELAGIYYIMNERGGLPECLRTTTDTQQQQQTSTMTS